MKNKDDDFNSQDISNEVEQFLRGLHSKPEADQSEAEEANGEQLYSSGYEEVKAELDRVFDMCEKYGFSIQVALSDDPVSKHGEKGSRITICGHMHPRNVPCEMVAAAAVYQSDHVFSHMVIALATTASSIIGLEESQE